VSDNPNCTTFMSSPQLFFTSESVTEGHPDKICDQISDAVLDAILTDDPNARVACETAVTTGLIVVMGEITTSTYVDIGTIARDVVRDIGYTRGKFGFDADTCGVVVSIKEQSSDIAQGVDRALEQREGQLNEAQLNATGAGDQGMMIGFACDETPEFLPMPIALAHRLARRLSVVRKECILPYLRPDGKTQVTLEYVDGKAVHADTIVVSSQHHPSVDHAQIAADLTEHVIRPVVPAEIYDHRTRVLINPTGRFVLGGPMADTGLTGRKIIVDTYGGVVPHGGGAFSGKDPSKVDRTASYMCRYVAKNIVAAGLADRVEVQVAYTIGVAEPVSLMVDTFGTGKISPDRIAEIIRETFSFKPANMVKHLRLLRPIFRKTACHGHFGRSDPDFSWEKIDMVDTLREKAGL